MAKTFDQLVKEHGSVAAALKAQGYTKDDSGSWSSSSGSSAKKDSGSTAKQTGASSAKQTSGSSGGRTGGTMSSTSVHGSSGAGSSPSYSANVDYHQQAIDAAARGDWAGVNAALSARQQKINAQGGNDRGTSTQSIYESLLKQYGSPSGGSPSQGTMSRDEMNAHLYAGNTVGQSGNHFGQGWSEGQDYLALALEAARNGNLTDAYTNLEKRGYKMADTGSSGNGISQAKAYQMIQQAFDQSGELERQFDISRQQNAQRLAAVARPYDGDGQSANAYKTVQRLGTDGVMYYVTMDGNGNPVLASPVGNWQNKSSVSYTPEEIDALASYYQNGFDLNAYYNLHNMAVDRVQNGAKYDENGLLQLNEEDFTPQSLIPQLQALGIDPILNAELAGLSMPQVAVQGGTVPGQSGIVGGSYLPGSTGTGGLGGTGAGEAGLDGTGLNGEGLNIETPSFEDFLDQMGYDQYSSATQQRIRAAVQQAVNNYNAQIDQANRETEELARQAYVASMLGQKNLDQQLSAAGYAGGMADSQRIQMQANYENNLRELETQRLEVVSELEQAIRDAQLTGDIQSAQELQDYLQQMQGSWLSYVQNQQSMAQQDYWNRQQMLLNQQQMNAEQTSAAYERALQLLGMGVMPGTDLLSQANLSQQEAEAIRSRVLAELGGGTAGGTGTSSSSAGTARTSSGTTRTSGGYDNGSLTAGQVRQMQQALGVTADGMWGRESSNAAGGLTADEAWAAIQQSLPGSESTGGFSTMAYSSYLSRGQLEKADEYLARYWGSLTDREKQTVNSLIKSYGY